jgi:hypothetical protein
MSIMNLGHAGRFIGAMVMSLMGSCGGSDPTGPGGGGGPDSYGVDHTCCDLSDIPAAWIDSVQDGIRLHYAHTSHGEQLIIGLERIEEDHPAYPVEIGYGELPQTVGALCIYDGQEGGTYITPDLFWETPGGMDMTRDVLDHNPSINVCMWCWCTQLDYYGAEQVEAYLDSMEVLEGEYPGVTFVCMTGNAQASGAEGYNRHLRNTQIREYCEETGRLLFDFADLDCWWYDSSDGQWEQSTYEWQGTQVPVEHPQFNGDEAAHTTYGSCEQKGRALWWLLALIAGWDA